MSRNTVGILFGILFGVGGAKNDMITIILLAVVFGAAVYHSFRDFHRIAKLRGPMPDPNQLIAAIDADELELLNVLRGKHGRRPVVFTRQFPTYAVVSSGHRKSVTYPKKEQTRILAGIPGPFVPVCQLCPVCHRETILHVMPNAMKANCVDCGVIDLDVAAMTMKQALLAQSKEWGGRG